jgi:hypothetical protein
VPPPPTVPRPPVAPGGRGPTGQRRRYAAIAAAVVLLAAASLGGWLLLRDDRKQSQQARQPASPSHQASATPSRTAGSPSAEPSSAAPSVSQSAAAGNGGTAAVPAGYSRRTDPSGFSLAIPDGWTEHRSGEGNRFVYYEDPQSARYLLVDRTDTPKADPVADWREQSQSRSATLQDYQEISIRSVDYFLRAADWEFTYTMGSVGPVHVRDRGFVTSETQGYALYLLTPADEWDSSQDEWRTFTETFRPAQ